MRSRRIPRTTNFCTRACAICSRAGWTSDRCIGFRDFTIARLERPSDRARYLWRTITTPQCPHYRLVALPDMLVPAYVTIKLAHDYVALPFARTLKRLGWRRSGRAIPEVPS